MPASLFYTPRGLSAMQNLTPQVITALNNLPGFPAAPASNPPSPYAFLLGAYLNEIKVRPAVAAAVALPLSGNTVGDVRVALVEQAWYYWTGAAWVPITGGGGGGGTNPSLPGQGTLGLTAGQVGYLVGANTWSPARADGTLLQSQSLGLYDGTAGTILLSGSTISSLQCTTDGGLPVVNGRLYLAASSADGGTAVGKATATPPTPPGGGTVNLQYIGVCVDNSAYAATKTVKAIFQPSYPVVLVG